MKKTLYIFALIASFCAKAQTILPTEGTELCPNQEYTFTVSGLPSNYSSLNSIGQVNITQFPSGSGTSITFKAKFGDVSGEQGFTVSYQGGSKPFKFTKVKSLFGGYSENFNNPTTLTVPICQTTPIALNISGNKYWNTSTNPYTTFGSITNYRYIIPAGWYLNSTLSNGTTWIYATGSVTITPNANTGNGATIQYVAKNDCSGAFFEGNPRYISISRPNPTFTLSPTSLTFACGTPQTSTFTVSTTSSNSCSTSYNWNLGVNNGWLYNGSPAPASFSTTTSSITLTSANGNILPSTVNVTPILNGTSYAQMSCTTAFTAFSSSATITGNTAICPSNSVVCTINNLGAGNTVTWSSSNTAVATVSGGTQSQVTVNGVANGFADIIATISNACGQTVIKKNTVYVGVPTTPAAGIYANPMWVRNNFFPLTIDFPVIPNATSYVWTIENDPENPPYCTTATSYPAKFVLNNSNTTLATTTPSAKINFGGCFGTYFIKCKAINNCGETDVFYKHIWVGSSGSSPCDKNNNISSEFKILQNPIKNGVLKLKTDILFNNDIITEDASILQGDGPCEGPWEAPIIGKISSQNLNTVIAIYDMAGVKRLEKQIDNNKESIEITNFNLPSGNYILHFKKGNQISKKIIIIE